MKKHECFGCRGFFSSPPLFFVTHPYIGAPQECWSAMLEIIQRLSR